MATNPEIENLRAEARRRHAAATRKISRIRKTTGAIIANSGADPRRNLKTVAKYNRKQLTAYIDALNQFNNRSNQYVSAGNRSPIPLSSWQEYKRLETALREKASRQLSKYGDKRLPGPGTLTVAERMEILVPKSKGMRSHGAANPREIVNLTPDSIESAAGLDKLIKTLKKKVTDKGTREELKRARINAIDMVKTLPSGDFVERVSNLSNDQFEQLWYYSPFADQVKLSYEIAMAMLSNKEKAFMPSIMQSSMQSMDDLLKWAEES